MNRKKVLQKAASVIASRGLCKGQYCSNDGQVDGDETSSPGVIGAINVVQGHGPGHESKPFGWVESELMNQMMKFNDMPSTTRDDIESLLMSLAEEC